MAAQARVVSRTLVVRALVAASLALLVAGALAPLLTTERFYFFSNTFSLVSALRQLVTRDQIHLAVLIGLFSLCVPVVKAAVIWIAAHGRASNGPLLALAERLGKWSMLEVFVAALLITALKLGPVVDATLHYGAYLLAGSAVLAGAASQLLPHEAARPLFSSPVTLTVGGVVGAVAATVLIGFLNHGSLDFDAILATPEARCIERTLELDRFHARTSTTPAEYVARLRSIEANGCPEAFRSAFEDYVAAWVELEALDANGDEVSSWLDRARVGLGLVATRDDRLRDIEQTWAEMEHVALEHGVQVPAK